MLRSALWTLVHRLSMHMANNCVIAGSPNGQRKQQLPANLRAEIANESKPLTSRATYATVSNPPLDQKVEMTNWEKVSDEESTSTRSPLTMSRVITSTTSKDIVSSGQSKDRGFGE